jgi:hypothetical protein
MKKKISKKTKPVKSKLNYSNFDEWWSKVASKKVDKIENSWIKETEPNDPDDDEGGGDNWHVNEMMHNGDAHEMTCEISQPIFEMGLKGESWTMAQTDSLYCDLDSVIAEAYEAGKKLAGKKST